jgi:hypothetical protein
LNGVATRSGTDGMRNPTVLVPGCRKPRWLSVACENPLPKRQTSCSNGEPRYHLAQAVGRSCVTYRSAPRFRRFESNAALTVICGYSP